jgi:hypothetical protein
MINPNASQLIVEKIGYTFVDEVQPERSKIIKTIVSQAIYALQAGTGQPVSASDLHKYLKTDKFGPIFKETELNHYLELMQEDGIVLKKGQSFDLGDEQKPAVVESFDRAMRAFYKEIRRLVGGDKSFFQEYLLAFIDLLCHLFSTLGEDSAYMLPGGGLKRERNVRDAQQYVPAFIKRVCSDHPNVDDSILSSAVWTFFNSPTVEGEEIIRHMVQGYFTCKALSINESGALLAKELYGNGTFYVDTNALVPALDPFYYEEHHKFETILHYARALGITLKFCRISLVELEMSVRLERKRLEASIRIESGDTGDHKIVTALRPKYEKLRKLCPETAFDLVFQEYENPKEALEKLGICYVDDDWFEKNRGAEHIEILAEKIFTFKRKRSATDDAPTHPKVCEHDALLMAWLNRVRKTDGPRNWLLTRDTALSHPHLDRADVTITMDNLIQWMACVNSSGDASEDNAVAYSELVKRKIFPGAPILTQNEITQLRAFNYKILSMPTPALNMAVLNLRPILSKLDPNDRRDFDKVKEIVQDALAYTQASLLVRLEEVERREKEAEFARRYVPDYQEQIASDASRRHHAEQETRAIDKKANVLAWVVTGGTTFLFFLGSVFCAWNVEDPDIYQKIGLFGTLTGVTVVAFGITKWLTGARFRRAKEAIDD